VSRFRLNVLIPVKLFRAYCIRFISLEPATA
jgi:hypothetical protein